MTEGRTKSPSPVSAEGSQGEEEGATFVERARRASYYRELEGVAGHAILPSFNN